LQDLRQPLSDDEWDDLQRWLDAIEPGRFQRTLGLLHAIAVAPTMLEPSRWLPLVIAGRTFESQDEASARLSSVLRVANEVRHFISMDRTYAPDADAPVADASSFASGFILGADLDATWLADEEGRAYATALLPLVTSAKHTDFDVTEEQLEARRAQLRERIGVVIIGAHRALAVKRGRAPAKRADSATSDARAGRNDPCPCGSGKKLKKCCGGIAMA
jgi:uncharacterized protein